MKTPTDQRTIERFLHSLKQAEGRFARMSLNERREILTECLDGVRRFAREWVEEACKAKGIPPGSPFRVEEVTAGPVTTARFLRLLQITLTHIAGLGKPKLPGKPVRDSTGRILVPILPERKLFDGLLFRGFKAHTWLSDDVEWSDLDSCIAPRYRGMAEFPGKVCLVLGAGNVSSIPITDALSKVYLEGAPVLLKMNPVNDYLGEVFEKAFEPLIRNDLLRIVYGGTETGSELVRNENFGSVHITGSIRTHDVIVWGDTTEEREERKSSRTPLLTKPITSELGNVTPWIIVPGNYSRSQLDFQAENVVASITNNASFNCIATKVLITWKPWSAREKFLDTIEQILSRVPPRKAYYPGALERFARFSQKEAVPREDGTLPWTFIRGVETRSPGPYFCEESFVCVCVEVPLEAGSEEEFLKKSVDFVNDSLWGTLGVTLTIPNGFRKDTERRRLFESCIRSLRYGTIAVNHWTGLAFALAGMPWGGYPGNPLWDVQSGTGWVHNAYMLEGVEKSYLEGPLKVFPKPIWFPTHRNPEPVGWRLLELYCEPGIGNLARVVSQSLFCR